MTKKTILMALFCAGISIAAFAQEEPGAAALPVDNIKEQVGEIDARQKTAKEMVEAYLLKKGWTGGPNTKNGVTFQVAVGYGTIDNFYAFCVIYSQFLHCCIDYIFAIHNNFPKIFV